MGGGDVVLMSCHHPVRSRILTVSVFGSCLLYHGLSTLPTDLYDHEQLLGTKTK